MSPPNTDKLSQTVFDFVKDGSYPDDEQTVSAEFPSSSLQSLATLLESARSQTKESIKELSRLSALDIDGWISQAKQLKRDIDQSQDHSADIVKFDAQGKDSENEFRDVSAQISLLQTELLFNDSLAATLAESQELGRAILSSRTAVAQSNVEEAVRLLGDSERKLAEISEYQSTSMFDILAFQVQKLRQDIISVLVESWNTMIRVDAANRTLEIDSFTKGINAPALVRALSRLGLLEDRIAIVGKAIRDLFLLPKLRLQFDRKSNAIVSDGSTLRVANGGSDRAPIDALEELFNTMRTIIEFSRTKLPELVSRPMLLSLLGDVIPELIRGPLPAAVPPSLDGIAQLQKSLRLVQDFATGLERLSLTGHQELSDWVESAPRVWLARRSQQSMDEIRQILQQGLGERKAVERVETQIVSSEGDAVSGSDEPVDNWDTQWSDEETEEKGKEQSSKEEPSLDTNGGNEGEDSAWGFDDDEIQDDMPDPLTKDDKKTGTEDDTDNWGWGDEDKEQSPIKSKNPDLKKTAERNGQRGNPKKVSSHKEITLKETYHISSVPDKVLQVINKVVEDADHLSQSDFSDSPVAPAAEGLHKVPSLLLLLLRAIAKSLYETDENGNMFLYSDSLYIAENLRRLAGTRSSVKRSNNQPQGSAFDDNVQALETFGKRAYAREMESQRTILTDLLDGAQGFVHCTQHPFAQEADLAVASVIDRLRGLHKQWKPVLSRSALLQSMGSLLSTVTNKMVVDIEDLSDISEEESQRLTAFCNRLSSLDDLFLPDQAPGTEPENAPIPLTAVYTPTWLKFQYLTNILESPLADIKFLWTEGELSLEFDTHEVVDLIKALFSNSDNRRKIIEEIKKSSTGH